MFSFDNYQLLVEKVHKSGDPDYIEEVDKIGKNCLSYVNSVEAHQKAIEIIRFRYDAEEMKERVREADLHRHVIHEAAITNCKVLNRIADMFEVGKIFTGDINNRFEVADFCFEVAVKLENYKKK